MKLIALVFLLVASAVAESMDDSLETAESYPVQSYHSPAVASSGHGQAYGAYGRQDSGHAAYGQAYNGDHGRYSDRAQAARGHHDLGGYRKHDAYGAQASNYGRYKNVGAYAQDKGAGYEKAYAYDKKAGHHDVRADSAAQSGRYGVHDQAAHHNQGAYAQRAHDRYGAQDKYGGQAYGVRGHDNSAYDKYGSSHGQQYYRAPAYGHGY